MLFFIDESWQSTKDEKYKVGVLAAVQIKSHDGIQESANHPGRIQRVAMAGV